jgi:hypothetical protein
VSASTGHQKTVARLLPAAIAQRLVYYDLEASLTAAGDLAEEFESGAANRWHRC